MSDIIYSPPNGKWVSDWRVIDVNSNVVQSGTAESTYGTGDATFCSQLPTIEASGTLEIDPPRLLADNGSSAGEST